MESPTDGEVELVRGDVRQVWPLRAPRTEVDAQAGFQTPLRFAVDLQKTNPNLCLVQQKGTVPLLYNGAATGEAITYVPGTPLEAGGIQIAVRLAVSP